MKEACKAQKRGKRMPIWQIEVSSPAGASQLSALGNPEYLLDASVDANIESVTFDHNYHIGVLSPLKSPAKRAMDGNVAEEGSDGERILSEPILFHSDNVNSNLNNNGGDDTILNYCDADNDDDVLVDNDDDLSENIEEALCVNDGLPNSDIDSESYASVADSVPDMNSATGNEYQRTSRTDVEVFDVDSASTSSSCSAISNASEESAKVSLLDGRSVGVNQDDDNDNFEKRFFEYDDFIDVTESVNSDAPTNLRVEEELLLHIIKEEHLPPRVFDRIMKWGKLCCENNYDFDAPGFRTAMKRWKDHYMNSALKAPFMEIVHQDWQSVPSQVP